MNILIVGHEGYVGSGLFEYFLSQGLKVLGWGSQAGIQNLTPDFIFKNDVQLVINCAAVIEKNKINFEPNSLSELVNVLGVKRLVEAIRVTGVPLIHFSTKDVFGLPYSSQNILETEGGYRPKILISEKHPFNPLNAYGKSKLAGEAEAAKYANTAIIRLSTCYTGQLHKKGSWIQHFLKSSIKREPIQINGNGKQFRDPLHVHDLAALIELIYRNRSYNTVYNAGGGIENLISLNESLGLIGANRLAQYQPFLDGGTDFGFAFDSSKALKDLNWSPKILINLEMPKLLKAWESIV